MKILHVYPQLMCGGTETVFFNFIKYSKNSNFEYCILTQRKGEQEAKFLDMGCRIFLIPYVSSKSYRKELSVFFRENKFQAVHCHMHNEMDIVLEEARKSGVPHCISHSHNARIDVPKIIWPLRYFKHHKYEKFATDLFGCSQLALKWLFPCRWKNGIVIYNGIDLDAFKFNLNVRNTYRSKLGITDDSKVVINVGRCTDQKNQNFILDCAKTIENENILFLIIGEGPLFNSLKQRIDNENLQNVRLLGKQFDIPHWLCAADIFIFPSIYEGLGIVAVEAQASGLHVLSTDSIPSEVDMSMGTFHRISLGDKKSWNSALTSISIDVTEREKISMEAIKSNYNIYNVVREVEQLYAK